MNSYSEFRNPHSAIGGSELRTLNYELQGETKNE